MIDLFQGHIPLLICPNEIPIFAGTLPGRSLLASNSSPGICRDSDLYCILGKQSVSSFNPSWSLWPTFNSKARITVIRK